MVNPGNLSENTLYHSIHDIVEAKEVEFKVKVKLSALSIHIDRVVDYTRLSNTVPEFACPFNDANQRHPSTTQLPLKAQIVPYKSTFVLRHLSLFRSKHNE